MRVHGRRYRYYVSSRLRESREEDGIAWRVPAEPIEQLAVDAATDMLRDSTSVSGWIGDHASAQLIPSALKRIDHLIERLSEARPAEERRVFLQSIFRSITLSPTAVRFEIVPRLIVDALLGRDVDLVDANAMSEIAFDDGDVGYAATEIVDIPVILKRRGNEMRLVIDRPFVQQRQADPALVDLVARAHVYLNRLASSSQIGSTEIAKEFGVDRADVGRILPLAFLCPAILEAILTGQQAPSLTARRLARFDLPMLWTEQEAALRQ